MARKRRKGRNEGLLANRRNKKLTPVQRELIVQTHAACGSIASTSRELGIARATVQKVIREAEQDTSLQAARGRALDELAGKAHHQAERVLGSISDEELNYERVAKFNSAGQFTGFEESGPKLADKARTFGIFADKVALLQQARRATLPSSSESDSPLGEAGLLLPQTVDEAKRMIAQKVRRLRIVDLEFAKGETGERVRELTNRANLTEQDVDDADYVPFGSGADPFD